MKKMNDVITIGDGMITFHPASTGPMRFVNSFERKIGGAELNFAIGCARLGLKTGWISRLGRDEFGRFIKHQMRGEGIDTSEVKLMEGYPTSLNFKEMSENGSGRTFYYREKSPTSTMTPDDLNEDYFKQAKLLHVTGVFPAIGGNNAAIVQRALTLAKRYGLLISFYPNIRLKLWSKEEARRVLTSFLPYVDILLTGEEEADILVGTSDPQEIIQTFFEYGIKTVVIKRGEDGSIAASKEEWIEAPSVKVPHVVDTIGAGDGFDAGFIYGVLNQWPLEKTVHFANTVGAMVVSVRGDNEGLPFYEDVLAFMGEREVIER
ncbi:2-dehydro-3-deoxygluconokinase [Bacillus fengqiuensis]|nr:2-dehydro-3-deoxygluconokinase [Bacillus fengqiuensis]